MPEWWGVKYGEVENHSWSTLSVKHSVYYVMVWACMAASERGALVYSDETLDWSSRVHSTQIQPNSAKLIGQRWEFQKGTAKTAQERIIIILGGFSSMTKSYLVMHMCSRLQAVIFKRIFIKLLKMTPIKF